MTVFWESRKISWVSREIYINDGGPNGEYAEPVLFIVDVDGKVAYFTIASGPKGLPSPGDIAPVLLYMKGHGGRY